MSFDAIARRAAGSAELFLKRHGPEILTSVGIASFGATAYLVGRAVLKAQPEIEDFKKEAAAVRGKQHNQHYGQAEQARELGKLYITHSARIVKIFSPAIATGSAAVFCVIASHGMMRSKQASLLAAYTALDAGFKAYRQRVAEEIGVEKELELYRRPPLRALDQVEGDEEAGIRRYELVPERGMPSIYAKFFDESNPNWQKTPEWNLMFLSAQQNWANERLTAYGFVFLNEVYEMIGLPRTQAGQVVGWLKDGNGDGFVDFGLHTLADEAQRAFVNGLEASVLLDFNVDGPISI